MHFQAGLLYFDSRPLTARESAEILDSFCGCGQPHPARWEQDGLLMSHTDPLQPHIADTAAITFDGRIDNRDDLEIVLGHLINGQATDAALALAAYQRGGGEGLVSLIGDWSLAIWDRARKQLVLASDFAGVRPLYYSACESHIRWSTRLKPLASAASGDEIDDEYVASLLMRGACPNRTPYRGVFSVPPGHFLVASASGVEIQLFWKLPIHDSIRYAHEADYEEHLRDLFRDAVRCRLRSPAPVLSEMSGGLDSSSIACMANRLVQSGDVTTPAFVTLTYEHQGSRDKRFQDALEFFLGFRNVHLSTEEHAFLTESHTGDALPLFWEALHRAIAGVADQVGATSLLTGSLGDLVMGNWHDDSDQILRLFRSGHCVKGLRESLAWSLALHTPIY